MSVLSIDSLHVSYSGQAVINDFTLSIESNEVMALFGPSGSGKTTVLKAVAGLLDETSGQIVIENDIVLNHDVNLSANKRPIGLIFQDYALFPHLTVRQNIAFGLSSLTKSQQKAQVDELLDLIKLPLEAEKYPHQLSGGQQQRVAIARALATKPKLMLFDESFSNIDPQFRFELIADIRNILKQQNIAGLFVTHNQDEAFAFCDRIAVLNAGKVEQIDQPQRLFNRPATRFVAEFLGQGLWLDCTVKNSTSLSSELGDIVYAGDESLTEKSNVQAYVRPHQLKLFKDPESDLFVLNERFVGEFFESEIAWQGQMIKVKTSQSYLSQPIRIGVKAHIEKVF